MKVERIDSKDYVIHYEDFDSLLADTAKSSQNRYNFERILDRRERLSYFGPYCPTAQQFIRNVIGGWPELTDQVIKLSERLKLQPDTLPLMLTQATRRKRVRADAGSDLDIHAVYQGQLDRAWSATRHELHDKRRKAAHLYIAIGGNHNEDAIASQWRAAAAYRIGELFQRCGFSVEITVGATAGGAIVGRQLALHTSFTAKASHMPMDLNRLALQSTLGWHRVYSWLSRVCNDRGYDINGSMGYTIHGAVTPYVLEREASGELLVYIPSSINNEMTAKRALDEARHKLETYGRAAA